MQVKDCLHRLSYMSYLPDICDLRQDMRFLWKRWGFKVSAVNPAAQESLYSRCSVRHSSLAKLFSITCPAPVTSVHKHSGSGLRRPLLHPMKQMSGEVCVVALHCSLWCYLPEGFSQGNRSIHLQMSLSLCIPAQPKAAWGCPAVTAAHVPGQISYTAG